MTLFIEGESYFRRQAMFHHRWGIVEGNPEISNADLAPLMGEHEREFWTWTLERTEADARQTHEDDRSLLSDALNLVNLLVSVKPCELNDIGSCVQHDWMPYTLECVHPRARRMLSEHAEVWCR